MIGAVSSLPLNRSVSCVLRINNAINCDLPFYAGGRTEYTGDMGPTERFAFAAKSRIDRGRSRDSFLRGALWANAVSRSFSNASLFFCATARFSIQRYEQNAITGATYDSSTFSFRRFRSVQRPQIQHKGVVCFCVSGRSFRRHIRSPPSSLHPRRQYRRTVGALMGP